MASSTTEGVQGVCPAGWHLPTRAELTTLSTYLGGDSVAGGKLKQAGTTRWMSNYGDNSSGFDAVGSGVFNGAYSCYNSLASTNFWASTYSGSYAISRLLFYDNYTFTENSSYPMSYGYSVRCIKN